VSLKHVYEIAVIKQQDPNLCFFSLQDICRKVIACAKTCGIAVVPHLDAKEYGEFLEHRKVVVEEQLKELQAKKEAKMLRTA